MPTDEAIDGLAAMFGRERVAVLARGLEGDRSRLNAAHEFGHVVGLRHPNDPANPLLNIPDQNLMSQTAVSDSEELIESQLRAIADNPEFRSKR